MVRVCMYYNVDFNNVARPPRAIGGPDRRYRQSVDADACKYKSAGAKVPPPSPSPTRPSDLTNGYPNSSRNISLFIVLFLGVTSAIAATRRAFPLRKTRENGLRARIKVQQSETSICRHHDNDLMYMW